MEKLLDVLKSLSDETRLRILNLLYERELCVCDVMETLQISQAKASRHLIYLKNAGLVKDRKQAQWAYYSMSKDERLKFLDNLVYDNLRNMEPYKRDMENLNEWLQQKNTYCDCNEKERIIMKKVEIFDPAMCCPTGVCGPSIDPELLRMATVINSLKEKGIIIKRHGLASEPQDFIANKVINAILQKEGAEVLPVTLVDGEVAKTKAYPTNGELSQWLGVEIKTKQSEKTGGCCCGSEGCC